MLIGRAMSMMTVTVGVLCGVRLTMAKGSGGFTHTTEWHGHAPWVWGGLCYVASLPSSPKGGSSGWVSPLSNEGWNSEVWVHGVRVSCNR